VTGRVTAVDSSGVEHVTTLRLLSGNKTVLLSLVIISKSNHAASTTVQVNTSYTSNPLLSLFFICSTSSFSASSFLLFYISFCSSSLFIFLIVLVF
jgi:hypothetical protein